MYSCDDIFDLAIQIEKNGERTLRKAQEKISNPKLIPLLKWLADEEVEHAQWLLQLKSAKQKPIENPELEAFGKSLLRDILGDQSFSLADADFTKIKKAHQLLSLMIEFENDIILFYEMIRSVCRQDYCR
ncbi:MAG: rubrerythrin [Deltaproteobacteria bacterium]|nr:rubrerythrin [Deltaproteobacteria bacterium]